jgi:hypothetical protein
MKTLEISEAAASLAEHARCADKQPIVLTLNGQPLAALVGLDSIDFETLTVGNNAKFLSLIERSRSRYKTEGGIPADEMRRRMKKADDRRRHK